MALFSTARPRPSRQRRNEEGYVLLTLLLVVSLMAIATLAVIIPIKFEIQREQETEMIHRGVQYSRAIRGYFKKWGRYPTRLEDLENTNNLRYLRKRYKDPLNKNRDFRLLHYGEQGVTLGGSIGGGAIAGATPAGSAGLGGSAPGSSAFGGSGSNGSAFGGSGFGSSGANSSGVFSQSSGVGGNSSGGFGSNSNSNSQTSSSQPGTNPPSEADTSGTGQGDASSGGQQPVASGPIVGVASVNKSATIREFNKKKKYNEWQFIYDPSADRGGLITTPYQPALPGFGTQPGQNMQSAGTNGSSFGNSSNSSFGNSNGSSFGQSSGFGNNPNPGGAASPPQPPANPPQQQ